MSALLSELANMKCSLGFFLQAEDGIRDRNVTGVQTCALPISYDLDEHSRLEWLGSGERAEYLASHDAGQDFLDEITVLTKQLERSEERRVGKERRGRRWQRGRREKRRRTE